MFGSRCRILYRILTIPACGFIALSDSKTYGFTCSESNEKTRRCNVSRAVLTRYTTKRMLIPSGCLNVDESRKNTLLL